MRWPRGKYNGRRITGLSVKVRFDISMILWKPRIRLDYQPFAIAWLVVIVNIETMYHYMDR